MAIPIDWVREFERRERMRLIVNDVNSHKSEWIIEVKQFMFWHVWNIYPLAVDGRRGEAMFSGLAWTLNGAKDKAAEFLKMVGEMDLKGLGGLFGEYSD